MVSFNKVIVASMALIAPIVAQTTPAQVVSNINMLTQKSQALQDPANSISIINGPLIIAGQGPFPQIITGFTDIVSTATTAISQMQGMPPVAAGAESNEIFEAFRDFVRVHQALLNILIGKAGLFQTVPFIGQPITVVLRQVEGVVDTIAFGLIDTVESRASDLQSQAQSLSGTLQTAMEQYEGIANQLKKRSLRFAHREVFAAA